MKKLLPYRDIFYILIIFAVFWVPRQKSTYKQLKPNRQEIQALQKKLAYVEEEAKNLRLLKEAYMRKADSLQKHRQIIYNVIQKQNEDIRDVKNLPAVLDDSTLFRIFSNTQTEIER